MTDLGGKTCIFSHPVYLFLREFSLQDSRGGSLRHRVVSKRKLTAVCSHQTKIGNLDAHLI
ncbi:hypothetical protein EBM27_24555 [Escherichia coli]|nr:hypothetical protein [Escherichia coli]MMR38398.1 hypothetical protein [Escherichia coli]QFG93654.1 hypothetical protein D8Z74_16645 [Escherichia coli]